MKEGSGFGSQGPGNVDARIANPERRILNPEPGTLTPEPSRRPLVGARRKRYAAHQPVATFTRFTTDSVRVTAFWEKAMSRRVAQIGTAMVVLLGTFALPAAAEILSIAGLTQAEVTEYRSGVEGDADRAMESYPDTSAELPIQVVARLIASESLSGDGLEEAAAAVAAQFADPRTVTSPNPEEFAINLALNSVSENIYYQARALSQETRGVQYSAGEVGLLTAEGDELALTGRLYLDGALTLLAVDATRDLTGAYVTLSVTVVKRVEGHAAETVFSGAIALHGAADATASVVAEGSFPTGQLILSNLGIIVPDFAAFQILIVPNIAIDYPYTAIVGQEFTLEATVEVTAANLPDNCGVAAVLGTPTDMLTQVIALTQGSEVASKTVTALTNERADPTGEPAFPQSTLLPLLFPLCGGLGFETLVGLAALVGIRSWASPRRRFRK
jgi:hypothetical protein